MAGIDFGPIVNATGDRSLKRRWEELERNVDRICGRMDKIVVQKKEDDQKNICELSTAQ